MKAIISLYADLWNRIVYTIRKELFEISSLSKCMRYECYLITKHRVDRNRMFKAITEARKVGKATFYSEVFKKDVTIITI